MLVPAWPRHLSAGRPTVFPAVYAYFPDRFWNGTLLLCITDHTQYADARAKTRQMRNVAHAPVNVLTQTSIKVLQFILIKTAAKTNTKPTQRTRNIPTLVSLSLDREYATIIPQNPMSRRSAIRRYFSDARSGQSVKGINII